MKSYCLLLLIFATGCFGDTALRRVSLIAVPGTQFSIQLNGPDRSGCYHYYVISDGKFWIHRPLGKLSPSQTSPTSLDDLHNGVFRVRWGRDRNSPFAIIDVRKRLVVADSCKEHVKNEPFSE